MQCGSQPALDWGMHLMKLSDDLAQSSSAVMIPFHLSARRLRVDRSNVVSRVIPLFRFDAGWPFVVAGLALLVSGLLIPAQRELHDLKGLVQYHQAREQQAFERLAAYDRFLQDLQQGDERVLRRLAASQLNLKQAGAESLMLSESMNDTVVEWIDASVPLVVAPAQPAPDTLLSRLASGPRRLWILGIGTFLLFIGLFVGPETEFSGRRRQREGMDSRVSGDVELKQEVKHSSSESIPSLVEVASNAASKDAGVECVSSQNSPMNSSLNSSLNSAEQTRDASAALLAYADGGDVEGSEWTCASPGVRECRVADENECDIRA